MSSLNPPLNKDDFLNSSWQEVINSCSQKECLEYSIAFWNKSKEVENVCEKAVLKLLAVITDSIIHPEQTETVFKNLSHNLTEESLTFLADIVHGISDPELQARVADILWVKRYPQKGYYKMAQLAIDAYLKSAQELEKTEHWCECLTRIERALRLAISQINDVSRKEKVINYIEEFFERYQGKEPISLSLRLMELLQKFKIGDPQKYLNLCQEFLQREIDWEQARLCYNIQAKWYLMNNDQDNVINSLMLSAETYVKQANINKNSQVLVI